MIFKTIFITFVTLVGLQAMEPHTQVTTVGSEPLAPQAPDAPLRLPTRSKLMYAAAAQAKVQRPLDQFIPIEDLRKLIAQYASEWVPYRTFNGYPSDSPYSPVDFCFSQTEDSLITIEPEVKNTDKYKGKIKDFHTERKLKTKKAVQRQPIELCRHSKLSFYGNYFVNFPGDGMSSQINSSSLDGKINKQWPPEDFIVFTLSSCCSESNQLVACSGYDKIILSDIQTEKLQTFATTGFYALQMAISPNGQYLAAELQNWCGHNNEYDQAPEKQYIAIFEIETGRIIKISKKTIPVQQAKLFFSPDSKTLVVCQGRIYFVNLENNMIETFDPKHQFGAVSMSYSREGNMFATTSQSETAIWGRNPGG